VIAASVVAFVVARQRHDGRSQRILRVCGVESASHAHLEHRNLDARAAEMLERRRRQHLEVGRLLGNAAGAGQALGRLAHATHGASQGRVRDVAPIHRDPLVDADQVRRGVAPGPQATGAQRGVNVRRD
jgi:hypothetical protein